MGIMKILSERGLRKLDAFIQSIKGLLEPSSVSGGNGESKEGEASSTDSSVSPCPSASMEILMKTLNFLAIIKKENSRSDLATQGLIQLFALIDGGLGSRSPAVFDDLSQVYAQRTLSFLQALNLDEDLNGLNPTVLFLKLKAPQYIDQAKQQIKLNLALYPLIKVAGENAIAADKVDNAFIILSGNSFSSLALSRQPYVSVGFGLVESAPGAAIYTAKNTREGEAKPIDDRELEPFRRTFLDLLKEYQESLKAYMTGGRRDISKKELIKALYKELDLIGNALTTRGEAEVLLADQLAQAIGHALHARYRHFQIVNRKEIAYGLCGQLIDGLCIRLFEQFQTLSDAPVAEAIGQALRCRDQTRLAAEKTAKRSALPSGAEVGFVEASDSTNPNRLMMPPSRQYRGDAAGRVATSPPLHDTQQGNSPLQCECLEP